MIWVVDNRFHSSRMIVFNIRFVCDLILLIYIYVFVYRSSYVMDDITINSLRLSVL